MLFAILAPATAFPGIPPVYPNGAGKRFSNKATEDRQKATLGALGPTVVLTVRLAVLIAATQSASPSRARPKRLQSTATYK